MGFFYSIWDMFCHWKYDQITAIKSAGKKPCIRLRSRSPWLTIEKWFPIKNFYFILDTVMKHDLKDANDETLPQTAFGVKVTVT